MSNNQMREALQELFDAVRNDWKDTPKQWKRMSDALEKAETTLAAEPAEQAWMDDYNDCKCPENPTRCFSDRVFRMMQKHANPTPEAVNQQMLEALKLLSHCMTLAGWENDWANTRAKTAIAAAEASKEKS